MFSATPQGSALMPAEYSTQLQKAKFLYQRKRYDVCTKLCEDVIRSTDGKLQQPMKAPWYLLKGKCLLALSTIQPAYEAFYQAITLDPQSVDTFINLGKLFGLNNQHEESVNMYKRAYEFQPNNQELRELYAIALCDWATIKKSQRDVMRAVELFNKSVELNPQYAPAHYNLGVVNNEQQQLDQAEQHYKAALAINPKYRDALCNLGVIAKQRGNLQESVAYYEQALEIDPNFQIGRNNLAIVLTDVATTLMSEGNFDKAIETYHQALYFNPCYPDAHYNLGAALAKLGRRKEAMVSYELALAFRPSYAEAYNNLGILYKEEDNIQKAIICYTRALQVKRTFIQALSNLSLAHVMQGNLDGAIECCKRVVDADSSFAEIRNHQGMILMMEGQINEAIKTFDLCTELNPAIVAAMHNKLLSMTLVVAPYRDLHNWHVEWGQHQACVNTPRPAFPQPTSGGRLHIAYICPDFRSDRTNLLAAIGAHTDAVDVTYITQSPRTPSWLPQTKCLNLGAAIHEDQALLTKHVAELRRRGISVLIDLCGHTTPNRMDLLMARAVPVQISYWGYPISTGLPTIDAMVTDALQSPVAGDQTHPELAVQVGVECEFFNERPVRLPRIAFACPKPTAPLPTKRTDLDVCISFGTTVPLSHVSDYCIALWSSVLLTVPDSRLMVVTKTLASERVRQSLLRRFHPHKVDVSRIDTFDPASVPEGGAYAHMDVFLDSHPHSSAQHVCEALAAGVPVLTLASRYDGNAEQAPLPASRAGGAIIASMGEGPWRQGIARSQEGLAIAAHRLAQPENRQWLRNCAQDIRDAFVRSPVCDVEALSRELEGAYQQVYQNVSQGGAQGMPVIASVPPM
ncbi:TPR repeat [Carpediemonas membranifera]|uniref:Probable UDP-N-acetylglucosamine--peptide N-acetylglucosaminyltransferase SPINDLY n=1 Tax=Carpediemonas membranifera TaxID=201153 RepID=A0A8J6ASU8_9EUKA|nr:TPR repeat [Carpediemonas membranifera]|eukprot:KAG9391520.1 TPR repeat [Carpediemonas membranifera]